MSGDDNTIDFEGLDIPDDQPADAGPGALDFSAFGDAAAPAEVGQPLEQPPESEAEGEEEKEEKPGLLARIAEASPFTVMLGLALLAVTIAVVCLAMELSRYGWDIKASDYKQVSAVPTAHSGPPSNSAVA